MIIDILTRDQDFDAVFDLLGRAADYVKLETGREPTDRYAINLFEERPPGIHQKQGGVMGLTDNSGVLLGASSFSFGYPDTNDCYIGLLIVDAAKRSQAIGSRLLAATSDYARKRGAQRQLVAVLEVNPKGRAFWEREGFLLEQTFPPSHDHHTRYRLVRAL